MIALIIVSASVAVLLTVWALCRAAAAGGRHRRTALEEPFPQGERKWSVMEAMCIVFVFAGLVCLGLLSPLLYAAATVLPLAAGLLRRLIRLIGGSR